MTASSKPRARILVVDDHPVVRGGLMRLIAQQPDLVCCGEAGTAAEARQVASKEKPDLAIVDLRLKQGDGLDLIKTFKVEMPALRVLVLSQHTEPIYVERALRAGALGYIAKEQDPAEVVTAIRTILDGQVYLTRGMAARLLHTFVGNAPAPATPGVEQLTDRELGILHLLGAGKSTREIAAELNLSFKTVESHRENIKRKLDLHSAAELVHFATNWVNQPTQVPLQNFERGLRE